MKPKSTTNGFVTSTTGDLRTDALDSSYARYVVITGVAVEKLPSRKSAEGVFFTFTVVTYCVIRNLRYTTRSVATIGMDR
jgi:hypothetical protein